MYKLLNAGFTRLMKNKMFWTIIIINLGIAGFVLINRYQSLRYFDETLKLEELLTTNLLFIGIFLAIFISIFVGIEYSDGVIRNKIIAGHSRTSIYISNLMISILGALLIELIYMLFITIIGTFLLGAKLIIPIYTFVFIIFKCIFYSFYFNNICTIY